LIETEPKPRSQPPFSLDDSLIPHIRHYVRSMNQTGQYLSVRRIRSWLIQEHKTNIPIMTLFRFLARIGIVYGTGKRRSSLIDPDKIIIARREYLRRKIKNRRKDGTKKRPEVYLDESYINQNISNDKTFRNRRFLGKQTFWKRAATHYCTCHNVALMGKWCKIGVSG